MFDALKKKMAETAGVIGGNYRLPEDQRNQRYDICKTCDQFNSMEFCKVCGCFMPVKTYMPGQSCPVGKWASIEIRKG